MPFARECQLPAVDGSESERGRVYDGMWWWWKEEQKVRGSMGEAERKKKQQRIRWRRMYGVPGELWILEDGGWTRKTWCVACIGGCAREGDWVGHRLRENEVAKEWNGGGRRTGRVSLTEAV